MTSGQAKPLSGIALPSALVLACVLLFYARGERLRSQIPEEPASNVAVEHASALTLRVHVSTGKEKGIAEFSAETEGNASLSVPASWTRREVRGGSLESVQSDDSAFGFTRWRLPAGVTLSFWTPDSPAIAIHNPSRTPLLILAKRVNVKSGAVEEKSMLVKEKDVRLW